MRVYIGGTFDRFHPGHLRLIKAGRMLATNHGRSDGRLVVALNSDQFVKAYKGRAPVHSYAERLALVQSIRDVDQAVLNTGGDNSGPTIERQQPDIILAGADWASPDGSKYFEQLGVTAEWLDARHITVVFLPRVGGHASSEHRPGSIADGLARGLDPVTGLVRGRTSSGSRGFDAMHGGLPE
jgi:glycerol-3-phosphate cytidylyltransferase